jgi:putative Mg2+ transporter-C (MgtC) family protein
MDIITDSVYFQIVLALVLGSILGVERNFAGKTAGMRTYGLVSMSSCLFVIISSGVLASSLLNNFDPMRLAAAVVTGIGFLGAGAIMFRGSHISGLTTAAGLWVSCGLGLAVGFHMYGIAIFTAVLTLIVFTLFWNVEHKIMGGSNGNGNGQS